MSEKIVMYDSDEAASVKTLTGWVSRDGIFCGNDEAIARYRGCTHRECSACGGVRDKHYTYCDNCRRRERQKKYDGLEHKEWDGKTPLTMFDGDEYFFELEDIEAYCDEHQCEPSDLMLMICEPNYPSELDEEDFCQDLLAEDMSLEDVAPELVAAIEEFNKSVRKFVDKGEPMSWTMGTHRTTVTIKQEPRP